MAGRTSAAIVRIALATAVLLSLYRLATNWPTTAPPDGSSYRAVGVWMLCGNTAPAPIVIATLWIIAFVATFAMLLGACTRIATALSFIAFVALASLSYAGVPKWSHAYNIVLLGQLAFLGARGGDMLSIDALVRGRSSGAYQTSLWLVQFAVALVFASAVFMKLQGANYTLAWVTSDNMRNQLLVRYDAAGLPRPAIVNWIIDRPWAYRGAAAFSVIAQTVPLLACIFVRRRILRAICALSFIVEMIAIGVVMQLWNLEWLLLAAAFIDWDALLRTPPTPPQRTPPAIRIFALAFVAWDVASSFLYDQWFNAYPFTSFPMFAKLRADPPYDVHQPYRIEAGRFEVVCDPPIDTAWLDYKYRAAFRWRDQRSALFDALADVRRRYPTVRVEIVRLWLVVLEAPAYPAPATLTARRVGVIAELHADGTFNDWPRAIIPR